MGVLRAIFDELCGSVLRTLTHFSKGTLFCSLHNRFPPTTQLWESSILNDSAIISRLSCFSAVPQSCAAEVQKTLPAAFSLLETATGAGFHLIQASHTSGEQCDI